MHIELPGCLMQPGSFRYKKETILIFLFLIASGKIYGMIHPVSKNTTGKADLI